MDPTTSTLGRARAESPPTHGDRRDRIGRRSRRGLTTGGAHLRRTDGPEHRRVQQVFAADRTVFSVRRPDRHALLHQMLEAPTKSSVKSRISSPATNSGPGQDSTRSMS